MKGPIARCTSIIIAQPVEIRELGYNIISVSEDYFTALSSNTWLSASPAVKTGNPTFIK